MNAELHKTNKDYGTNAKYQYESILPFLRKAATVSILDYGCGKGELQKLLPFQIQQYDPAIVVHNRPPKPAKVVVCTDVMEHVEEDRVEATLDHIHSLATQMVIFIIALGDARSTLPDGRNAHITKKPVMWWLAHLIARWEPELYKLDSENEKFIYVGHPHTSLPHDLQ